jgi:hypothetical protein
MNKSLIFPFNMMPSSLMHPIFFLPEGTYTTPDTLSLAAAHTFANAAAIVECTPHHKPFADFRADGDLCPHFEVEGADRAADHDSFPQPHPRPCIYSCTYWREWR